MRECWINVYPERIRRGATETHLGCQASSPGHADMAAIGSISTAIKGDALAKALRKEGVGYRLHIRLKVPALPATDALAAVKAGEDENGRAA